jgi:hypothetical protein
VHMFLSRRLVLVWMANPAKDWHQQGQSGSIFEDVSKEWSKILSVLDAGEAYGFNSELLHERSAQESGHVGLSRPS